MANEKIHEYTKVRTAANLNVLDVMDLDATDDGGSSWESAQISVQELLNYMNNNSNNIYVSNGTLTEDREVTGATFHTRWTGGDIINRMADELNDYAFLVQDVSSTERGRFGFDQATASGLIQIGNVGGTFFEVIDNKMTVNTDRFFVDSDNVGFGTTNPISSSLVDVEVPNGSVDPLSLYENRSGGANTGDNFGLNFYFNDDIGSRTLGGQILARVGNAPTTGDVQMEMILMEEIKIQNNNRVLITPTATTKAAVAQFEVRGENGVTNNTVAQFRTPGDTNSQLAIRMKNNSNQDLAYQGGTGKWFHNPSQLSGADFQMRSQNEANLFYMDSSADGIGIGTATPNVSSILEVSSTTKGFRIVPMTVAQAGAITPVEGLIVFTSDTDGTFPTIGLYCYENGSWNKL